MKASAEAPLCGRDREIAALDRFAARVDEGDGRLLVLRGPAGIGKTRLLDAARERAGGAGWRVLLARADELELTYSYGAVRQWLQAEWTRAGHGRSDAAALVLSRSPAVAPAGEDATFGIVHALYLFVSELALKRPLLLALDDAQWADPESLRVLAYIQRRLEGLAIGIVIAARQDSDLLDRICEGPRIDVLALEPLAEADCTVVLQHAFGTTVGSKFSGACRAASGGNPLYLVELQRALAREGTPPLDEFAARVAAITPASLSRHVLRRLATAGAEASRLAGALSVLGDGGSLRHAATMAGVGPRRAAVLAKELTRLAILVSDDPIRFAHPLVRRAVADQLTSVEHEDWRLHAARLLLDSRASPERAAGHLLQTRPAARDWCVEILRDAGREALSRSAPEAAVAYLRRALDEPPARFLQSAVLRELGVAETLAHDPRAIEHLERARDRSDEALERAEIALDLAAAHLDLFQSVAACRAVEDALDGLGDEHAELSVRLEAALAANAWLESETVSTGLRVIGKHWDDPPRGAPGRAILAQKALAMRLVGQPATHVCATAMAALEGAAEDDLRATFETALSVLVLSEGFEQAADQLERVAELRSVHLVRRRLASLELIRGWLALRLGALGDADLHLSEGLRMTPAATSPAGWLVARGLLTMVLTSQARLDEAERVLAELPAEPWPRHVATTFALAGRAALRIAHGHLDEALADYATFGAIVDAWQATGPAVHDLQAEAAVALAGLGRHDEAIAIAADALKRARAFGSPVAIGAALRAAGIADGGPAGVDLLREAVSVLASSPAALERARAHVELGAALRRSNQRRAAREHLDSGLRIAQRCGARLLAQRAFDELESSGKRLRRSDLLNRDALTPTELRITRLAVQGLTNREIAGTLYLSIKTVEMHLGRAYRKLDITARAELADALQRLGLM